MELLDGLRPRDARAPLRAGAARARDPLLIQACALAGRSACDGPDPSRHQAGQPLRLPLGPEVGLRQGRWTSASSRPPGAWETTISVDSEGTITGTPAYMAPEAALGGQEIDARVDLYGLGCVAYWLLTGERVFVGRTPVEVLMHHIKTPPVPPSERVGRPMPASLEALVLSCLAKDPDERPVSAEWLAARLAECETAGEWTPARAHEWWDTIRTGATQTPPRADPTRTSVTPRVSWGGLAASPRVRRARGSESPGDRRARARASHSRSRRRERRLQDLSRSARG